MTPEFLSIRDKKVAFVKQEFFPNRPYLVFLHDSLGCIELWRDFPEKLAKRLKMNVFIYDRLGYGQSDSFIHSVREVNYMDAEAEFLKEVLDTMEIEKPILFGHSDGGTIALLYASKFPSNLKSLIVEGAHIFVEEITLDGIREAKRALETTNLFQKLERYHGSKTQALLDAWIDTWLSDAFRTWNIERQLETITRPILVIQGENDEFGSDLQVLAIMNKVQSQMKQSFLFPNAKHTPHKEIPEVVLAVCEEFVFGIED